MSASNAPPSTPFEWLSGGLFFGKGSSSDKGIGTSRNVAQLMDGMSESLELLCHAPMEDTAQGETIVQEATNPTATVSSASEPSDKEEAARLLALRLSRLRFLLYDERRASSSASDSLFKKSAPVAGTTAEGFVSRSPHLIPKLLSHLCVLPFESRKHVAAIFNYLLVCGLDGVDAELYQPAMELFRDYIVHSYDSFMKPIIEGHSCGGPDISLHCGSMFRSCLRHVVLYEQLVTSTQRVQEYIFPFLDTFVQSPNFDVASDAMESLRLVFVGGDDRYPVDGPAMVELASQFLTRDYEAVFDERFNPKLLGTKEKNNYMTKRMALQILSTVLLTRSNYNVMIKYVANKNNLILCMLLLRDTSPHITLDAFHVFKIFVANPNKPPEILKILTDNKVKLCRYLETLHQEREASDAQFRDEKALVISTIEAL